MISLRVSIALLVGVVSCTTAGTARADALSGELLLADHVAIATTSLTLASYACDTATVSTFVTRVDGIATGPYDGPFTETLRVTIAPQNLAPFDIALGAIPSGPVVSVHATFAIKSALGPVAGRAALRRTDTRVLTGTCSEPFYAFGGTCLYQTFDEVEAPLRYIARVGGATTRGNADASLAVFIPCTGGFGGSFVQRFA